MINIIILGYIDIVMQQYSDTDKFIMAFLLCSAVLLACAHAWFCFHVLTVDLAIAPQFWLGCYSLAAPRPDGSRGARGDGGGTAPPHRQPRHRALTREKLFRITQHMPEASDTELAAYILDECTYEGHLEHHFDDGYAGPELSALTWHRVARAPEHGV